MRSGGRIGGGLTLAACLSLLGCAQPGGTAGHRSTDLLPLLPFTESAQETPEIDLGTRLGDDYLLMGWSPTPPDGITPPAESVMYLRRRLGRFFFHVASPGPRTLELRCVAVRGARHRITVSFRLNGVYVGRAAFLRDMTTVRMPLPIDALRRGRNEVGMLATVRRALPKPESDRYGLKEGALACDGISVLGGESAVPMARLEEVTGGKTQLVLPPGATLELFAAGGASDLVAASPQWDELQVEARRNAGAWETLRRESPREAVLRVPLAGDAGDVVGLRLTARGTRELRLDRLSLEQADVHAARTLATTAQPRPRTSVILYVVDTMRADRLGCYGYGASTSPHVDALARESLLFEDAQAQASWTRPSVASILTGVTPLRHGAAKLRSSLGVQRPLLADLLQGAGYATAAFVTNMNVSPEWGFNRGFDTYRYFEEHPRRRETYEPASSIHEAALAWLREVGERPFFLYLHASDPHAPYTPRPEFAERFERLDLRPEDPARAATLIAARRQRLKPTAEESAWTSSLYDAGVAQFDAAFGEFVDALRASGILQQSLLIFVSDHGEEFREHGAMSHGHSLYQELVHVPLLIHFPDGKLGGRRIGSMVQHVDLLPTVMEYAKLEPPADLDGRSLLGLPDEAGRERAVRPALQHTWLRSEEITAVTTPNWKAVFSRDTAKPRRPGSAVEFYDRSADRPEEKNLAASSQFLVAYARQLVATGMAAQKEGAAAEGDLSPETAERLRLLGYDQNGGN